MKGFMYCLSLLVLMNCKKLNGFDYDRQELKEAWKEGDSLYLQQWVSHLEELDFNTFTHEATNFATTGNFCYGHFDVENDPSARYTDKQKKALVFNVIHVNMTYLKSCLFLNWKVDFEETLFIQENYWNDSTQFSNADLDKIRTEMEQFCK